MLIVVIAVGALGAWGAAERRVMAGRGRRISTNLLSEIEWRFLAG